MNDWLKLMLEEIRRKAREKDEALREHERRRAADSAAQPAPGAGRPANGLTGRS